MSDKAKILNLELENRFVRSATATRKCDQLTGIPNDSFYTFYESLAAGHPGLLIMEHSYVAVNGKAHVGQLGIYEDSLIQYHEKAIHQMKKINPQLVVCNQLAHAGDRSPSQNNVSVNSATHKQFDDIITSFENAALRSIKAGYDCVQIHAGHTFLNSQLLSDYYNKRTDEYKASEYFLLKQIVQKIKAHKIICGVKLQCDDFIADSGLTAEKAVKVIEAIDFDFVEITGGGQPPVHTNMTIRPGPSKYYYKHVVAAFKEAGILSKLPVICTGGFENVKDAQQALDDGCLLVGFSRKFIRNDKFLIKDDKPCKCCNQCISKIGASDEGLQCWVK